MVNERVRSRDYYERFLNQLKDADQEIRLLRDAKGEFARVSAM